MDLPSPAVPDFSSSAPLAATAALLEALPWGVLVLDAQAVIRHLNQQAAVWCGVAAEALLGQPLAEAPLPAALRAALQQPLPAAAAPREVWLPTTQQWLSLHAAPGPAGYRWVFWNNVTARHQAEAAQQRSHQLLLDMEAVAHTGSYEADLLSGSFYFSDGLYRLFGEAPQAFAPTLELIDARSHPADAATVRQVLEEAVRARQPYTYRRRICRADGAWRTLEAHGEVVRDAAGQAVQLRGLVQDVTERVQAEQALRESQELLQRTIDSSLDLVQVFEAVRDEQGAVVDFAWVLNNAAAEQVYGNVIGQRLCQLNPGVVEEGIFEAFRQVLATGVPDQRERHYVHEQFDGWFYQSTVKLGDGVATTTHDISARKRTEQKLRESQTLMQDVINAPNIGLVVYRAVRDEAGAVVDFVHEYINRASREMLGEDFTGKRFTDHGENGRLQLPQLSEVLATGRRNSYLRETDFRGRQVWFAITNTPLDGDRLVHTWEDVTARQRAEAEILRLKEELAQQATDKYHALFRGMDQGFCVLEMLFDDAGERAVGFNALEVNPRFAQESGMDAYATGDTLPKLVPALDDFWLAAYGEVVRTGEARRQERYEPRVKRWFDVHAFRIGPAAARQVAVLFSDISARKQAEQRQDFLLRFSDALRAEPSVADVAHRALHLLNEQLELDRSYLTTYYLTENRADVNYQIGNDRVSPLPAYFVLSDYPDAFKTTLTTTVVIEDDFKRRGLSEAEQRNSAKLGMRAMVGATLRKEQHPLWSLVAISAQPRRWTPGEIALIEEVAERTWAALERARAEEALAASEEQFRAVANLVPDLLWRSSPTSDTTWYNQRWYEYTGQTRAEAAGYGWAGVIHPDDQAESSRRYRAAIAEEQPLRQEHRIRSGQGEYRWFQVQARPLHNEQGTVTDWYGAATDIHARKLAELRQAFLLKLSDALRPLTDSAAMERTAMRVLGETLRADRVFLASVNADGISWSVREEYATGLPGGAGSYPMSDFQLKRLPQWQAGRLSSTADSETDPTFSAADRAAYAAFGIRAAIGVPLVKKGRFAALLCVNQATPRAWTEAELALTSEAAERIWVALERARAEEALRESEEKYRTLFDSIDEGFALEELVYDANGEIEDVIFREVNQAYERQGGLTNVVGKSIKEVLPNLEQHWKDVYAQVARTGEPVRLISYAQDVSRWFDTYLTLLSGSNRYVVVVFNDITERKQRELSNALLDEIGQDLAILAAPNEIMQAVGQRLSKFLALSGCYFVDVDEAKNEVTVHHGWASESVPSLMQTFRLEAYLSEDFLRTMRAGEVFVLRDTAQDERAEAESYARLQVGSFVTVPFFRKGRYIGHIAATTEQPHEWQPHEIQLLQEVAARVFPRIERARTEEALAASEHRLRALVANLPGAAAFVVGPDLRYQLAGGEALDTAGLTPADLLGRTVAEAMPPELVPHYEAHYRQALAGQGFSLEHAAHGRTFISRGVPLLNLAGQPEAVLVVSYDITARQQAEEALRLSEEKFRTLADTAPALIWFNDERGENEFVNHYFLDYIGHTPESVRGLAWHTLVHPDDAPTYLASYQQAVQAQRRWQSRSRVRRHDGAWHWFENYAKPLFDAEGRFLGHVGISADITASVRAQEALQVSETKYRTLFETMDQGFGIGRVLPADAAAGTPLDWQWLEVNPQFERLTGLARADVLSQTTRRLIPGLEESWYERYALAATGETVNFEAYSSVLERWFDVYAFALGPPDNRQVAVLFSNTSEQKQVEAALREAEARYREQLEQQVLERTQQLQANRDLLQSVLDTSLISMSVLYAERDEAGQVQDFRLGLVNKELERETGRTDLVGKRYAQEYPGIRQVGIFDLMLRALATNEPQGMEYFYNFEGFDRWFTCQFVKLGDGVVATNLDITERKTAEQDRLRNLRLLEQAEAVAGLGSWDYDLATGAMRWSEGMYHLFGLPVGSAVAPSHYLAAVLDDDRPRAQQLVHQLTAGEGFEETLRLRVHEQVKTVRMKALQLRDEAGQPARVLGVDLDISELQRLEADNLRLRLGQQQALFEAVQEAQEEERRRMSESLHNGIGQILYATKLQLDRLPAEAAPSPRQRAAELLSEAIRQTRTLSHELTPAILEDYGLEATLRSMCSTLSTPALRWHCHLVIDEGPALSPALQLTVYRLAQELAQNVLKHAQATTATLEVEVLPAWVVLRVEDNGRGFDPAQTSDGLGLRTLRSRTALLGGRVRVTTTPGQGTQCQIFLPLPESKS